jgi:hypothetical protein
MTSDRRIRQRRIAKWACALAAVLTLGGGVTGWMLFQHIPAWYVPAQVPAADLQAVRDDLVRTQDSFSEHLQSEGTFKFRITQDQINAWLAAREQMWPEVRKWVPPMMEDPFIAFEPGRVVLAGTVALGNVRTVLSASVQLAVDGKGLAVRLAGVKGGSLPVPDALVREQLRQLDTRRRNDRDVSPGLPAIEQLMAGTHVPGEFVWWNGNRRLQIRGIRVEHGAITFRIEPLPRHHRGTE